MTSTPPETAATFGRSMIGRARQSTGGVLRKAASPLFLAFVCATAAKAADLPLGRWSVESSPPSDAVREALRHFQGRVRDLGGSEPADGGEGLALVVSADGGLPDFSGVPQPRRDESYVIEVDPASPRRLLVRSATAAGAAHAVSDLETRLRLGADGVRLAFPEWAEGGGRRIEETPAIATRGEYLNIGYDLPGVTPHQWDAAQWRRYVDRLALARLNRWYVSLKLWEAEQKVSVREGLARRLQAAFAGRPAP